MSVHGEFERILGDCLTALAGSHPPARSFIDSLIGARERATEDVSAAAELVLDLERHGSDAGGAPEFGSREERSAFEDTFEHLTAICRVIVGR